VQQIPFIDLFKISFTCFGQQTRPSSGALFDCIYSFWFNAPILLPTGDRVEMELSTSQPCHRAATISVHCMPKAVYTVKKCSWGLASLSPETCEFDLKRSVNGICCSLSVAYIVVLTMHGLTDVKFVISRALAVSLSPPPTLLILTTNNTRLQRAVNWYAIGFQFLSLGIIGAIPPPRLYGFMDV